MIYGTAALQPVPASIPFQLINPSVEENGWTFDQHTQIVRALQNYGCEYLKGRNEYALLKQVLMPNTFTEVSNIGNPSVCENALSAGVSGSGVISPLCGAIAVNDTTSAARYTKPFLAPLDVRILADLPERQIHPKPDQFGLRSKPGVGTETF